MLGRKAHHSFAALKGDAALNVAALVVAFPRAVEIKHSRRDLPQGELTYGKKRPGLTAVSVSERNRTKAFVCLFVYYLYSTFKSNTC